MRTYAIICVLLVFSSVYCEDVAEETAVNSNVVKLTTENFDEFIANHQYVLVKYYAPWCGHCKTLAPEYEKAAEFLLTVDPPIILAEIDATIEEDLAKKADITGFPTLHWHAGGEVSTYEGGRDAEGIVKWCQKKLQPSSLEVTEKTESDRIIDEYDVVLAFFGNDETV